jgi:hypothetical protein
LVNFASLLGWSHSQKSDVFDLKELEQIVCSHRMKPQVMLLTIPLVQPENHSRQHCCCFRKALVPSKSTCPTLRCKWWP